VKKNGNQKPVGSDQPSEKTSTSEATEIIFSSVEEVEEKLGRLKLLDFSKGFVRRSDVKVKHYDEDTTKIAMENLKRDLLFKWGHPERDQLQLMVTHVELQFGYNCSMSTNGLKGTYAYFYCLLKSGFAL
jgi:hypothetical protein